MIRESKEKRRRKYWTELQVETSRELSEAVIDYLVSELHRGVIVEESQDDERPRSRSILIKAYLNKEDIESGVIRAIEVYFHELLELHAEYPKIKWDMHHIVEEEWAEGWKRYFKPVKIGSRLVIKPTWETYIPDEKEIVIEIDPGQAFGVGTHASTRLMLEALEETAEAGIMKRSSLLDIGTGTGILAIAAARLGCPNVMAIDIDQDAVEAARNNIHLNNVHEVVSVSNTPVWDVEGPFDMVLANLDRDTLLFLSRDISRLVAPGGTLFASGIVDTQQSQVTDSITRRGLNFMSAKQDRLEPEWLVLKFSKPS